MPSSAAATTPSRDATPNQKEPAVAAVINSAASSQTSASPATSVSSSTPTPASTSVSATAPAPVKKQRPLLPKETAQAVQQAVVWNPTKFQTSSQKWHMQKVQKQQGEQSTVQTQSPGQTRSPQHPQSQQQSNSSSSSSSSTRYQTRQAVKGTYTDINLRLRKMWMKMLTVCADFVCVCSATERCASECFINCRPGLIILSFNDRRRADPHSVGRRGGRYSQVHKQGRSRSSLKPGKVKKCQDCGRFVNHSAPWTLTPWVFKIFSQHAFFCADHGDDQRDNDGNLQRPFQEHNGKHNCRGEFWSAQVTLSYWISDFSVIHASDSAVADRDREASMAASARIVGDEAQSR